MLHKGQVTHKWKHTQSRWLQAAQCPGYGRHYMADKAAHKITPMTAQLVPDIADAAVVVSDSVVVELAATSASVVVESAAGSVVDPALSSTSTTAVGSATTESPIPR
mmetsp:Transcript_36906/g.80680  ORF Transcript_36906/g.80680 Transcript_36906/m.80680 type:complete len:107 (-) Transcript_36906:436-756(-)